MTTDKVISITEEYYSSWCLTNYTTMFPAKMINCVRHTKCQYYALLGKRNEGKENYEKQRNDHRITDGYLQEKSTNRSPFVASPICNDHESFMALLQAEMNWKINRDSD
uniref:Transposase n=1 Tax=Heterorhabditis bacteriophora TaxID=37862 RepID=A0A1I7X048_HETBA